MKKFSDFGIAPDADTEGFKGDKIKIAKVLNTDVVVTRYRVVDSKYEGKRVDIQLEIKGEPRLLMSGSMGLLTDLEKVPADGFPFTAKIIKDDYDRYKFQ